MICFPESVPHVRSLFSPCQSPVPHVELTYCCVGQLSAPQSSPSSVSPSNTFSCVQYCVLMGCGRVASDGVGNKITAGWDSNAVLSPTRLVFLPLIELKGRGCTPFRPVDFWQLLCCVIFSVGYVPAGYFPCFTSSPFCS